MKPATLTFSRSATFDGVSLTTGYAGAKRDSDPAAYGRVATTEADGQMLDRFWQEAMDNVSDCVGRYCTGRTEAGDTRTFALSMPEAWDATLLPGLRQALQSYAVNYIIARWCGIAERDDEAAYSAKAAAQLAAANRKIYYRQRPVRG